jgi:hypothetical protein
MCFDRARAFSIQRRRIFAVVQIYELIDLFRGKHEAIYTHKAQVDGKSTWFFVETPRDLFRWCGLVPGLDQPHITTIPLRIALLGRRYRINGLQAMPQ